MKFLFVTGISGAGRTQASKFLEDLGYFCIDNIPAQLLPKLRELYVSKELDVKKIALVIDIRSGSFYNEFIEFVKDIKTSDDIETEVLFLDCDDARILNRYKEMKRLHPLSKNGIDNKTALHEERKAIAPVLELADYVIDTTDFSIWDLKREIYAIFGGNRKNLGIKTEILSFGFKYGIPTECDIVFDVRFLPNPYYIDELRRKTGLDDEVRSYVMSQTAAEDFITRLFDLIKMTLPLYGNEGKELLVIGIGCTGGQHRSVAIADELGKRISALGYGVAVSHREKKNWR